ncbi:MAG: alanine racemase [Sphingomonadaceae bacterium]|nr:alanine racemase [Sphingomonadaceae bacterium]
MTNLRLTIDTAALAANWRACATACAPGTAGAAVKADGYGLGAQTVVDTLAVAGCRDFFVSSWNEAAALAMPKGTRLAVLHGVQAGEMGAALASDAVPVLSTPAQVAAWRAAAPERPCDVMVDTGINRLGLTPAEAGSGLLDGLAIDVLHSHLACADRPDSPHNPAQLAAFRAVVAAVPARRAALCNSAGIRLGRDYYCDLTRPGLALYGGGTSPVVRLHARVIQVRAVPAGASVGYGATWTAARDSRVAILNLGYADGYARALSNRGAILAAGVRCPVVGRVSMDLCAADVTAAPAAEGDWVEIAFDLAATARHANLSEYELLTGLGHRYARACE